MENDFLVSVVVPVYNAENFIRRCVSSILKQSYTKFELLLINDGSTDNSAAICKEFEKTDRRVSVYNKSNGGVSSARNVGIKRSRGEWICFIDADDWVEPEYIANLIEHADSDLVVNNFNSDEEWYNSLKKTKIFLNKNPDKIDFLLSKVVFLVPWCKIFKLNILKENGLLFDENLHLGEDSLFVNEYMIYIDSVQILPDKLYNYQRNKSGLSRRFHDFDSYVYGLAQFNSVVSRLEQKKCWDGNPIRLERFLKYMNLCLLSAKHSGPIVAYAYIKRTIRNKYIHEVISDREYILKGYRRKFFDFLASCRLYFLILCYIKTKKDNLY